MTDWFRGAGLGMFVHWDHASQQGLEVSWPLVGGVFALPKCQSVSVEQYHSSAVTFDPVDFDAGDLAARARRAGMTYAVFTTKHHSGYSMFATELSDFRSKRDVVREFVEAMRAEGLRVGLYYSLSDWSHPDYPPFTEADKPYRMGVTPPVPEPKQWDRYVDFLFGQVRELLTNYGAIDVMWFDGQWERPPDMWRTRELAEMIRGLQPGILINDRLPGQGDFTTPEQFVPATPPGGLWETCMTMNHSWGYVPDDDEYKSGRELIHTLCEVTGRGGNLLLNVSPTGAGALPREQIERLDTMADWMSRYRDAAVGTEAGLEPWQFYGPTTRRGERVYLHLLSRPYEEVTVRGVPIRRVTAACEVASGTALEFRTRTGVVESLMADPSGEVTIQVPEALLDPYATVLALDFANP